MEYFKQYLQKNQLLINQKKQYLLENKYKRKEYIDQYKEFLVSLKKNYVKASENLADNYKVQNLIDVDQYMNFISALEEDFFKEKNQIKNIKMIEKFHNQLVNNINESLIFLNKNKYLKKEMKKNDFSNIEQFIIFNEDEVFEMNFLDYSKKINEIDEKWEELKKDKMKNISFFNKLNDFVELAKLRFSVVYDKYILILDELRRVNKGDITPNIIMAVNDLSIKEILNYDPKLSYKLLLSNISLNELDNIYLPLDCIKNKKLFKKKIIKKLSSKYSTYRIKKNYKFYLDMSNIFRKEYVLYSFEKLDLPNRKVEVVYFSNNSIKVIAYVNVYRFKDLSWV